MAKIEGYHLQQTGEEVQAILNSPVRTTPQELTAEQKAQARENIGAASDAALEYSEIQQLNEFEPVVFPPDAKEGDVVRVFTLGGMNWMHQEGANFADSFPPVTVNVKINQGDFTYVVTFYDDTTQTLTPSDLPVEYGPRVVKSIRVYKTNTWPTPDDVEYIVYSYYEYRRGEWVERKDIPYDAVKYTPQNLTNAQKTQARANIGAGTGRELKIISSKSAMPSVFSTPKSEQDMAEYLGIAPQQLTHMFTGEYSYITFGGMESYSITYSENGFDVLLGGGKWSYLISIDDYMGYTLSLVEDSSVKYIAQALTDAQKTQARTNIGAGTYSKPTNGIPASDLASGVIPDVSNFITKSVDDLVNYYLKSETYTKDEVQSLIGAIQQFHYEIYASTSAVVSPSANVLYLIGPTGSGTDKYEEYVYANNTWTKIGDTSIDLSGLVTTQALNTALAAYTTTADLTTLLAGKQDTISDLTTIRSGAAAGATAYQKPANGIPASDLAPGVIPDVSQFITKNVNDLTNYYLKSETYTKDEVAALIGAIQQFHYEIVASLPATGAGNILYLLGPTGAGSDKYEEYVYSNGWVKIGDTSIDLSGYVTTTALNTALAAYTTSADLATLLAAKQDTIADLADIRSGAAAGATAYQKPQAGIPDSDLAGKYAGSPSAGGPANKALGIPYGAVDSDSTATDIKATVDNFPSELTNGVCAYIRNDVIASASGWTLNINGTGAKPVYASNADATRVTTVFSAASTYLFVYNSTRVEGGCWDIYYGYNANDNTIGYNLRTNTMSLPVTGACYRYRLLFTSKDGTQFVPANTSSSTNATSARTVNQTPIDPFGTIRYYSYTTAVSAGNRPGVTYLWEQYSVTLGYSFNRTGAALTLTSWKPVYIKCAPQSDGSAIIDADNPYVQELPSTEDGKIYIYLGVATSATQVEVTYYHPVFYFKDGAIRLWTNAAATSNGVQDVTVGGISVVTEGVAEIPAIPDISNCVQKSQTAGLLKNDGTVDTTAYGTYSKPQNGIPSSDMNADVQAALALAATSIQSLADYYDKEQVDAMLASVGSAYGVTAASLPTASAETLGKVYYIGPSNGEYTRYITTFDGTNYDWLSLGSTAIDLTDYATKEEVDNKWKLPDTQIKGFKQGYISTNGTYSTIVNTGTNPASQCIDLTVEAGQVYNIFGTGGNNNYYRLYAIFASDGTRLDRETGSGYYNPKTVTIPTGGVHLVINLREYNAQTDKVMLVGKTIDAATLQGEIDQANEDIITPALQYQKDVALKMRADRYSSVVADMMQYCHGQSGMTSVDLFPVVSSTSDTLTLAAEHAAAFAYPGPASVHFSDGTVKTVFFVAASGTVVSKETFDDTDLTNADYVQSLHDTVRGGAGIHLSPLGYIGYGQFVAAEIARRESMKDKNWLTGFFATSVSESDDKSRLVDADGNLVAAVETNMEATGAIDGNNQRYAITGPITAFKIPYGWTTTAYRISQTGSGKYIDFVLPVNGEGFVEVQGALSTMDGSSGSAIVEVYADGSKIYTGTLVYCQKKFTTPRTAFKREARVRITLDSSAYTSILLYSINIWRLPSATMLPAPDLSGKKVAVLGASWTQFPSSDAGIALYSAYNNVVTRPDGTTGDGYGYFPKELARVTGATVDNWGKSGMRVDNWGLEIIDTVLSTKHYDYIVIVFWLNDFNADVSVDTWASNLVQLAERCKAACVKPIILTPCRTNSDSSYPEQYMRVMRGLGMM